MSTKQRKRANKRLYFTLFSTVHFYIRIRDISNGNVFFHHLSAAVHKYSIAFELIARKRSVLRCLSLPSATASSAFMKQRRVLTASLCFHQWKELWLSWGSYVDEKVRYAAELSSNFCFLQGYTRQERDRKSTDTRVIKHVLLNK